MSIKLLRALAVIIAKLKNTLNQKRFKVIIKFVLY
jgi:hypothetical protein